MALFQCKIFSKELFRSVNVNVTLPTPDSGDCFFDTTTKYPKAGEKYQVLWLLHGFSADESDWQRFSSIERYAQEKKIAVVMRLVIIVCMQIIDLGQNITIFIRKNFR